MKAKEFLKDKKIKDITFHEDFDPWGDDANENVQENTISELMEEYANTKQLKWIPIDRENLPKGERLFKSNEGFLIGIIEVMPNGMYLCLSDGRILLDVTHYLDINKIEI